VALAMIGEGSSSCRCSSRDGNPSGGRGEIARYGMGNHREIHGRRCRFL
jgi:hypothetical protein